MQKKKTKTQIQLLYLTKRKYGDLHLIICVSICVINFINKIFKYLKIFKLNLLNIAS